MGLQGNLPADIGQLTELQKLDLSYNQLLGPLPQTLEKLTNLQNMVLVGCSFNGNIPDGLGYLVNLVFLALNSNKFSGSIPHSLGKLVNVTWLDLSDNQLSGTLPVSNANQSGLDKLLTAQHFHFSQNKLTGSIPPSLFSSDMKLVHVLFDSNDFYGEIPSTLELIQSLEILRLDRNSLTGTIPSNISNLTNLYEISREERLVEKTKAALAMQFGFADMKKIAMIAFLIIIIPMMIIAIAAAGITVNGMARTTYTTFEHVPVPDKLPPNCERVENCSQCSSLTCTLSRVEGWVCCND